MQKGIFQANSLDKETDDIFLAKQYYLPLLPYGIQKPYKNNSSKYSIKPNLPSSESINNKIASNSKLRKSNQQQMINKDNPRNKKLKYNIAQSRSQAQINLSQKPVPSHQYGKKSFQNSKSFSQARIDISMKSIKNANIQSQGKIRQTNFQENGMNQVKTAQGRITQAKTNQNIGLQYRLMKNHNNLSKHFQQHLNYQYESIHPNLQNEEQKNQLMKKQSIYIYIRKYLNAAYGKQGQLPKMRVRNSNKTSYQYPNSNIKSRNRLSFNINSKSNNVNGQTGPRLTKNNVGAGTNNNLTANKRRIQSYNGHNSKNELKRKNINQIEVQLKKQQYSRSYLKSRNIKQKPKRKIKDPLHINQVQNLQQDQQQISLMEDDLRDQSRNKVKSIIQEPLQYTDKKSILDHRSIQNQNNDEDQQNQNQLSLQKKHNFSIQQSEFQDKALVNIQMPDQHRKISSSNYYNQIDHQKQLDSLLKNQRDMIDTQNLLYQAKLSYQKHQLRELDQILQKQSDQQKQKMVFSSPDINGSSTIQILGKFVEKNDLSVQMTQRLLQQKSVQCLSQTWQKGNQEEQSIEMIRQFQTRQKINNCNNIAFTNIQNKPQTKQVSIQCNITANQQQLREIQMKSILQQKQRQLQKQKQRQVKQKIKAIKRQMYNERTNNMKDMKHSLQDIISTVMQMNKKADGIEQKFDLLKAQSQNIQQSYQSEIAKKDKVIQLVKSQNQNNTKKMNSKCEDLELLNKRFFEIKKQQAENRKKQLQQLHSTINELESLKQNKNQLKKGQANSQNIFTSPITKVRQYRYQQENTDMFPILQTTKQYDQISQQNPLKSYKIRKFEQKKVSDISIAANIKERSNQKSDKYIKIQYDQFQSKQNMENYNRQTYEADISVTVEKMENLQNREVVYSRQSSISVSQFQKQSQNSSQLFGDYLYHSSLYQSKLKSNKSFEDTSESNKRLQSKFTQTRNNINSIYPESYNIGFPVQYKAHIQDDQSVHI